MGNIICIASFKGGVGKTTTAVNLAAAFAFMGQKTLLLDIDPQGSATTGVGINKKKLDKTLYDAMLKKASADEVIQNTGISALKIMPVRGGFFRLESEVLNMTGKERILSYMLAASSVSHRGSSIRESYDHIIIDTPPSLGLLSINAMTAADSILIPLQCEFLAYESFIQLLRFIRVVKKNLNPGLRLEGILLTMYDMGEKVSLSIEKNARIHLKEHVFNTVIPRSVGLREASSVGKPLILIDPDSVGAESYLKLAREIMDRRLMASK